MEYVGVDSAGKLSVCGLGEEDGCRRLMSAGIGRIASRLMNEGKLATVE